MGVLCDLRLPLLQNGGWADNQGGTTVHRHSCICMCSDALGADIITCKNKLDVRTESDSLKAHYRVNLCLSYSLTCLDTARHV